MSEFGVIVGGGYNVVYDVDVDVVEYYIVTVVVCFIYVIYWYRKDKNYYYF